MILLSHPTANQNVRQAVLALLEANLLCEFWTGAHWKKGGFLDRLVGVAPRVRQALRRRSFAPAVSPYIRTGTWREWGRLMAGEVGWSPLTRHEVGVFSVDAVYRSLDCRVARHIASTLTIKGIYAYDAGALASFRAAHQRGIKCIYEHPVVSWRLVRQLQAEEAELQPEWAPTLGSLRDSGEKLARKDEELSLADLVVTGTNFARESISCGPDLKARIFVIPYGFCPISGQPQRRLGHKKLRVLFVGALSQAKGLSYLIEAAAKLESVTELTLIGQRVSPVVPAPSLLNKYRWIPSLSHNALLEEMSRHDVLVLPSLHEGFGLVITEAMAQGLIVITTPHTAGPDLITDGIDGFIVPIRSASGIEERLALLQSEDDRREAMQMAARRRALEWTWPDYRRCLAQVVREAIGKRVD